MCIDWQPIETAPKGQKILLCDDRGYLCLGLWLEIRDGDLGGYWRPDFTDIRFNARYWSREPTPPNQIRLDRERLQKEEAILAEADAIRARYKISSD